LVNIPNIEVGFVVLYTVDSKEVESVCSSDLLVLGLSLALSFIFFYRLHKKWLPVASHKRMFRRD
jgi:hypothetical protein